MAEAKLTAAQARRLHGAEAAVAKAKADLEDAEAKRAKVREKYLPLVPLSADEDEKKKGVRKIKVAGITVRVTPVQGGDSFSLKKYVEAGHKITKAMRDAISTGAAYDLWTVKRPQP